MRPARHQLLRRRPATPRRSVPSRRSQSRLKARWAVHRRREQRLNLALAYIVERLRLEPLDIRYQDDAGEARRTAVPQISYIVLG